MHFKCIIVYGVKAYFGSANLIDAGMGAKRERKRNFENGVLTDDQALVEPIVEQFDSVWRGDFCRDCGRRDYCSDPVREFLSPAENAKDAEELEVIFCCFSERDKSVYEGLAVKSCDSLRRYYNTSSECHRQRGEPEDAWR